MKRHLTDSAVKNAKQKKGNSQTKFTDGGGLYLLVNKSGKYWRYNYRFNEKHKTLALGVYPDISLKDVRKNTKWHGTNSMKELIHQYRKK